MRPTLKVILFALVLCLPPWQPSSTARSRTQVAKNKPLNVKFERAPTRVWGLAAAVMMVQNYVTDWLWDQDQVVRLLSIDRPYTPVGMRPYDLYKALERFWGTQYSAMEGPVPFTYIVQSIDYDAPVLVVGYTARPPEEGGLPATDILAAMLVVGYDHDGQILTVADPLTGIRQISYADLLKSFQWVQTGLFWQRGVPDIKFNDDLHWKETNATQFLPLDAVNGYDTTEIPLYICRARYRGAVYPGVVETHNNECTIAWGGKEISQPQYEVLVGASNSLLWDFPPARVTGNEPVRNELIGGIERGTEFFICRYKSPEGLTYIGRGADFGRSADFGRGADLKCLIGMRGREFWTSNFALAYSDSVPTFKAVLKTIVDSAVSRARKSLDEDIKRLTLVTGIASTGERLTGYDLSQLRHVLESNKKALLEDLRAGAKSLPLDENKLAGLLDYVANYYPLAENVTGVKLQTTNQRSHHAVGHTNSANAFPNQDVVVVVTTTSVRTIFHAARNFFERVRRAGAPIDLQVNSVPDRAMIELTTFRGRQRFTSTNSTFTNVVRGEYTYTVTRDGYKTVKFLVNLVDESGTVLTCELVESAKTATATPCVLK